MSGQASIPMPGSNQELINLLYQLRGPVYAGLSRTHTALLAEVEAEIARRKLPVTPRPSPSRP